MTCYTPDDCAIAGYCIPSKDDEPFVNCQHPSCIQVFRDMEAMVAHFDRAHGVKATKAHDEGGAQ